MPYIEDDETISPAGQAAEDITNWQIAEKILDGLADFEVLTLSAKVDEGVMDLELEDATMKDAFGPDWCATLVASIRKTEITNINNIKKHLGEAVAK